MSQNNQEATSTNKFTKREWILAIIILLIIEGFIFWISFQFSGNSSALGYVSFAGTLISIILAILAIGYTYGESQQQKNSSSTLANQLESLVNIKDKLEVHAHALEDIKHVKDSMLNFSNQIDSHFKENQQKIDFLNNNVSNLAQNMNTIPSKQTNPDIVNYFATAKTYHNLFHYLFFIITALFLNKEFKKDIHITFDELNIVLNEINIDFVALFTTRDYVLGGCIVTINTLALTNSFNYQAKSINPELVDLFKFCAINIKTVTEVTNYNREKFISLSDEVLNLQILKNL